MHHKEITINTAAYFPLNLAGSKAVYTATGTAPLELMPTKLDRVGLLRAPESAIVSGHESWRTDRTLADLARSMAHADTPLKAGLALLTCGLMPMGNQLSEYLLTTKPVVVYPAEISAAKRQGFNEISIQPTSGVFGICPSQYELAIQRFIGMHPDIGFTLDTQHTPAGIWRHICKNFSTKVREIHARVGVDVGGWARHLDQYVNADDSPDSPLALIAEAPPVPTVSEITVMAALCRYPTVNYRNTLGVVYSNIKSAIRVQRN